MEAAPNEFPICVTNICVAKQKFPFDFLRGIGEFCKHLLHPHRSGSQDAAVAQANSTGLTAQRISIMSPNELQELEPIAEALNAESNEINSILATLNAKLAALNVGLEVWLPPDEDHIQIGYAKAEESWQLATKWYEDIRWVPNLRFDDSGDWEPVPGTNYEVSSLLQESRELRIRALDYMPSVIWELKKRAEESLQSIHAAKEMAANL